MVLRSIPPITAIGTGRGRRRPTRRPAYPKRIKYPSRKIKEEEAYRPSAYKKPKEWRYVTKPFFAKIKEPLIDIFKEAQEVQIIIDLGGFARDEVSFGLKNGKYTIHGKHGEQEFKEVIDLPKGVDLDNVVESFKNNILGLVLPRKTKPTVKKRRGKKHEGKSKHLGHR